MNYLTIAQYVFAAACIAYGVAVGVPPVRSMFSRRRDRAPVDDLRLVIDLAARLRDAGKTQAVAVCQQLLDELLQPETKA
jgi:hypothetical protein